MLRKDVRFDDPGPPVTGEDLAALQAELGGITLPLDHARYLLRFNGASPHIARPDPHKSQLLRIWWPADTAADASDHIGLLGSLLEVNGRPAKGPDLLQTQRTIGHLLPPSTLVFADAAGGSRFLFDLRADRFGQVLFWNHLAIGDDDTFAANPYHNVGWVAHDFIDFINRIEVEPDDWNAWEAALPPDADLDWRSR